MTSKYTRRHYEDTARILAYEVEIASGLPEGHERTARLGQIRVIAGHFARQYAADNARFDMSRFMKAARQ